MGLTIESPEADRLARELSERTGQSIEQAVVDALRRALLDGMREQIERDAKFDRTKLPVSGPVDVDGVLEIIERVKKLPVVDPRPADELLGYDEWGLPH